MRCRARASRAAARERPCSACTAKRLATGGQHRDGRARAAGNCPINGAAAGRCSQLSTTSSRCLAAKNRSTASSADSPASGTMPSALTIAPATSCDRSTAASDTNHAPSAKSASTARAASSASRVLPTPPGPVRVNSRTAAGAQPLGDRADLMCAADRPVRSAAAPGGAAVTGRPPGAVPALAPQLGTSSDGVLAQDRPVHAVQLGTRLDPELLDQNLGGRRGRPPAPRPGARCDTARASAAPCSRSRVGCSPVSRCSSPTSSACRPAREVRLHARLQRRQPLLLQARDLRRRERREVELLQRRPRHSSERPAQQLRRALRLPRGQRRADPPPPRARSARRQARRAHHASR